MAVWIFFLFVYSQCVQSPLDSLDPDKAFDIWEILLYGMAASFFLEEVKKASLTAGTTQGYLLIAGPLRPSRRFGSRPSLLPP